MRNSLNLGIPILLSFTMAGGHLPLAVRAQSGSEAGGVTGGHLEEVVVTARKREERLQETPVAVSAFSASDIQERNILSVSELTQFVPNMQFDNAASESGGGGSSQISIRGIGQTDYVITVEPGVGLYLDGVYIGKSVGSLMDTVDLERVEVLRGPQGTLFGKNTIGGAIVLTSKRPSDEPEFWIDVTTGEYDRIDVKTSVSGQIHDRLRLRFSGASQNRDGHVDRVLTGQEQGNKDSLSGRLTAELDVTTDLLATVAIDGTRTDEQSPGQVLVRADESAFFAALHNGGLIPGVALFPECAPTVPGNTARLSNPDCFNTQWVRPVDSLENFGTGPNSSETSIWGTSLTLDWDLGAYSLKSITAYRSVSADIFQDLTLNPAYVNPIGQDIDLEQVSQELQLSGTAFADRLTYLAGFFWINESGSQRFPVLLEPVEFTSGGSIDNYSTALFTQATFDATDRMAVTLGLRYTHEKRHFRPEQQVDIVNNPIVTAIFPTVVPGTPLFPRVEAQDTDGRFTPAATLDYKLSDDVLTYFSYSQGFKGGGFTMRGFPPAIPGITTTITDPERVIPRFGPEKVELFELGIKSLLFNNRVRLNLAGFVTNYDDLQILTNTGVIQFVPVIVNAGDARLWGIEAETEVIASDWLRINGSLGWIDHEYLEVDPLADGVTEDDELPNAPEWSANLGATLDLMNNEKGQIFIRADWSYKSKQFKEARNVPSLFQEAYHQVSASISWESLDEHWLFTVGGTNLTDEIYIVSGVDNAGIGYGQAVVSRPREWFLRASYRY